MVRNTFHQIFFKWPTEILDLQVLFLIKLLSIRSIINQGFFVCFWCKEPEAQLQLKRKTQESWEAFAVRLAWYRPCRGTTHWYISSLHYTSRIMSTTRNYNSLQQVNDYIVKKIFNRIDKASQQMWVCLWMSAIVSSLLEESSII